LAAVRERVSERLFLVVGTAGALALADLTVKATVATTPWDFHQRSGAWALLSIAILVGAVALAFVPSVAVAVAAGVMSGGVIGNLVSARLDGGRVPNPLMLGDALAFNLADVFFLVGNFALMAALIVVTLQNRERLHAFRRRLRSRVVA
jgi:hypothetical protein